jgi:putative hydrolase of the HAD superfamily
VTGLPTRPRVVLFDVGETLVRVDPSWGAVYAQACREFGLPVDDGDVEQAADAESAAGFWDGSGPFEASREASFQRIKRFDERIMARLGYPDLPEPFYRRIAELFESVEAWHVFPDVAPTLDRIAAAGIRAVVVSNWMWGLPELLHDLDLARHFEHIVVSSRVGYDKPHPAIFRHALELAGIAPSDAIHVGDNPKTDVGGAREAGVAPVLIRRKGDGAMLRDRDPDLADVPIIEDLGELVPLLGLRVAA